jgi:steroid delta-isomerase-like uncharacterized protein
MVSTTSVEAQNKALFRRFIEELWNQQKLEVADELYGPDAYSPNAPQLPNGPEGLKQIAQLIFTAFPDFHMTIEDLVAEGDLVVGRYAETGTHLGPFFGIPPTGKTANWSEIGMLQIKDGKIAVCWFLTDMMTLMMQLGVIPPPPDA